MKKEYEKPELELLNIMFEDIILGSGEGDDDSGDMDI